MVLLAVLLGVAVILAVLAALAQRRARAIQSNPNFAPTDHVELEGGRRPREIHHDTDPPDFQLGD